MPPLCGLEAEGDARYEDIEVERVSFLIPFSRPLNISIMQCYLSFLQYDQQLQTTIKQAQKIMVWPVRLNVNLKGKTLEELRSMRKNIHMSIGLNTLLEIKRYVAAKLKSQDVTDKISSGSIYDNEEEVQALQQVGVALSAQHV